jgi:hypothetical protein
MRRSRVFWSSFLDGFTFAGFLTRLRRPDEATQICAPGPSRVSPEAGWQPLTFEPLTNSSGGVAVAGNLRTIPEPVLHTMIDLLRREDEERKSSGRVPEKAGYGASR